MTRGEILRRLTEAGIDDPRGEGDLLLTRCTGLTRAQILANPETDYDSEALAEAVARRCTRYPLQYLFGEWEFYGMPFWVSEDCLIPRPDTEILVEEAIRNLPEGGRLLDLCTGSGCIAAAVLANRPDGAGLAMDVSPGAARMAEENLRRHGLTERCPVKIGDVREDILPADAVFDVITANPPYITAAEMEELAPELAYEPEIALTDGGDGLSLIRAILQNYLPHLKPGGVMLIEHGWQQAEAVREMFRQYGMESRTLRDYGGNERVTEMRFPLRGNDGFASQK